MDAITGSTSRAPGVFGAYKTYWNAWQHAMTTILRRQPHCNHQQLRAPAGVTLTNPSVAGDGGPLQLSAREVNYRIRRWTGRYSIPEEGLKSATWLTTMAPGDEFTPFRPEQKLIGEEPRALELEDARLFTWRGALCGIWSQASWRDGLLCSEMVVAEIADGYIRGARVIASPYGYSKEKNWIPLVIEDDLLLFHSLERMDIWRFDGELQHVARATGVVSALTGLSGSSQFVPWPNGGYIAIAHSSARRPKRLFGFPSRIYTHRIVHLAESMDMVRVSRPFSLQKPGVEFCAGLMIRNGLAHLTYGVDDSSAHLMTLPVAQIETLLGASSWTEKFRLERW